MAREESIWREEHDLFGAGEGEAEHGIGKERDGRMRRRLLARIRLEDSVFSRTLRYSRAKRIAPAP